MVNVVGNTDRRRLECRRDVLPARWIRQREQCAVSAGSPLEFPARVHLQFLQRVSGRALGSRGRRQPNSYAAVALWIWTIWASPSTSLISPVIHFQVPQGHPSSNPATPSSKAHPIHRFSLCLVFAYAITPTWLHHLLTH